MRKTIAGTGICTLSPAGGSDSERTKTNDMEVV